jgi:hypothetical protein
MVCRNRPRVQATSDSGSFHRFGCPRPEPHLTYTSDIDLTTEFTLAAGGTR